MIKPSEVNTQPKSDTRESDRIERQFDDEIRIAEQSGQWPARVPNVRDGASVEVIRQVAERYRKEGWRVELGELHKGKAYRATIYAPETP